ncbi:hypothetical protein HI914_00006 [Erysiphe necator]|nr:hypothetical protein HI914_00006 [Erysiphe necator]
MSIAYDKNIHLCVGCGRTGHLWEKAYLKKMVFGGPGISAYLLVLESKGAYYEEAEKSQNQKHGYAFEIASAASSSESEEESISLEAFLTGPAQKRLRIGKPEENGMKTVKALREIVGRKGLGPLNYRALAEKLNVPLNLIEFFQASPDAAKEFRKMSQRLNIRKGLRPGNKAKTKAKISADCASVKVDRRNTNSRETLTQSDFNIDPKTISPRVNPEHKVFDFVAVLRVRYNEKCRWKKLFKVKPVTQADQGSELNIISQGLVNAMVFPQFTLSCEKDDSGLFIFTAGGGATEPKEFTCFNVGKASGELHLLLGLLWLYEANVVISVRTSSLVIWDKKLDVLQPKIPFAFRSSEGKSSFVAETEDSQADDESSDTTDSEDMMSDTEDSEAESLK